MCKYKIEGCSSIDVRSRRNILIAFPKPSSGCSGIGHGLTVNSKCRFSIIFGTDEIHAPGQPSSRLQTLEVMLDAKLALHLVSGIAGD